MSSLTFESDAPTKVEFALGSEVSPGHFFKSTFARSFVNNTRDARSLDYEFLNNNGTIPEEVEERNVADGKNNNFFSLMDFRSDRATPKREGIDPQDKLAWKMNETNQPSVDTSELEKLRKQCHALKEENRRLQTALTLNQVPHVQVIDNVFLQTQIDTLQWQLKQTDANRQMYRSLMEQVARFLDRAHKSLDILHEKNNSKDKSSSGRVPRSRSVHAVHADSSPSRGTWTSSSSSSNSSRFTRAKSVNQISPATTGLREFTWSVLRRNDPVHCTPPRNKTPQDTHKTHEGVAYRRPKQLALDPDEVPPQKLSQEAFRLMRTVQSLLAMREPELARMSPVDDNGVSASPVSNHHHHHHNEGSLSLQSGSFLNSAALQESSCGGSDRGNESSSGTEGDGGMRAGCSSKSSTSSSSNAGEINRTNLQNLLPGVRRSLDATSLNSGSSKTTEEEDSSVHLLPLSSNSSEHHSFSSSTVTSTPIRRLKKMDKRSGISANGSLGGQENVNKSCRSKAATSVSSAEDESGFSSMSSFQEVGLPAAPLQLSPVKGCHTEVGLPEIPLEKITTHRRWTSTPAEIQALIKRHSSGSFSTSQNTESLSVWV